MNARNLLRAYERILKKNEKIKNPVTLDITGFLACPEGVEPPTF